MEPAPPSAIVLAPNNKGEHNCWSSKPFRAKCAKSQGSEAQGGNWALICSRFGRTHRGIYRDISRGCFKCDETRHFMRECPKTMQGNGTSKGTNRFFALKDCQKKEDSSDFITGMI